MGSIVNRVLVLQSVRKVQTGSDAHLSYYSLYSDAKRPELETGCSSEVKNEWFHTSNLSYTFISRSGIDFSFVLTCCAGGLRGGGPACGGGGVVGSF
jgi:hypothetical protein